MVRKLEVAAISLYPLGEARGETSSAGFDVADGFSQGGLALVAGGVGSGDEGGVA